MRWLIIALFSLGSCSIIGQESNSYLECFRNHSISDVIDLDSIGISNLSNEQAKNLIILLEEQVIKSYQKSDYESAICLVKQNLAILELYFPTEDKYMYHRILLSTCYIGSGSNYHDSYIFDLATLQLLNNWMSNELPFFLEKTYQNLVFSTSYLGMKAERVKYRNLLSGITTQDRREQYVAMITELLTDFELSKIDFHELIDITNEFREMNLINAEDTESLITLLFGLASYHYYSQSNKSFEILDELCEIIDESKFERVKTNKAHLLGMDLACCVKLGNKSRLDTKLSESLALLDSLKIEVNLLQLGGAILNGFSNSNIGEISHLVLIQATEENNKIADYWLKTIINLDNYQLSSLSSYYKSLSFFYFSNDMFDSFIECQEKVELVEKRFNKVGIEKATDFTLKRKKSLVLNDYKFLESESKVLGISTMDLLTTVASSKVLTSHSEYNKWYDSRIINKDRTYDLDKLTTFEYRVIVLYDYLSRLVIDGKLDEFPSSYALLKELKISTKKDIKTEGGLLLYLYTLINAELVGDSLEDVKEIFVRNYPLNVVELTLINEMLDAGKLSDAIKLNLKRELGIRFPKEPEGIQKFPLLADLYFTLEEHLSFHNDNMILKKSDIENNTINEIEFSSVRNEELCHCFKFDTTFSYSTEEIELIMHEYTEYKSGKEITQLPNILNFAVTLESCFDGGKINFVIGDGLLIDINLSLMRTKRGYFYQNYEIEYGNKLQNRDWQQSLKESNSDYVGFGGMVYNELKEPLTEFSALDYIRGKGDDWVYLPGTLYEVEIGSDAFERSSKFSGDKASESAFRSSLDSKVLHIATHGFTADESGSEPGLVFSYSNSTNSDDDGYLYLGEVLELDLTKVELVVLSACNSGTANYSNEGEMNRLSDAFLSAGARNVIFTDDYIDDHISVEFMKRFFKYYTDMENVSLAFRRTFKEVALHYPNDFNKWNAFNFKTTR